MSSNAVYESWLLGTGDTCDSMDAQTTHNLTVGCRAERCAAACFKVGSGVSLHASRAREPSLTPLRVQPAASFSFRTQCDPRRPARCKQSFFAAGTWKTRLLGHITSSLFAPLDLVVKEAKGSSYTECNYTYDASSLPRPCSPVTRRGDGHRRGRGSWSSHAPRSVSLPPSSSLPLTPPPPPPPPSPLFA